MNHGLVDLIVLNFSNIFIHSLGYINIHDSVLIEDSHVSMNTGKYLPGSLRIMETSVRDEVKILNMPSLFK